MTSRQKGSPGEFAEAERNGARAWFIVTHIAFALLLALLHQTPQAVFVADRLARAL